jgi:hypothetical protein
MNNLELQSLLKTYPDNIDIKMLSPDGKLQDFEGEVLHTSDTAYVDDEAPEGEWDTEEGKVELGNGRQYLLLNPIIV